MTHPKTAPAPTPAQLSGDSSNIHGVGMKQSTTQTDNRRFGPSFEKPCRNRETIICMRPICQAAYDCQWKVAAPDPVPIAYGVFWHENIV